MTLVFKGTCPRSYLGNERSFVDLERSATLEHTSDGITFYQVASLIKNQYSRMLVFRRLSDPGFLSPLSLSMLAELSGPRIDDSILV